MSPYMPPESLKPPQSPWPREYFETDWPISQHHTVRLHIPRELTKREAVSIAAYLALASYTPYEDFAAAIVQFGVKTGNPERVTHA